MIQIASDSNLQKNLNLDKKEIISFCKKWNIKEFYFFGSVLTENFSPEESDIDVMLEFLEEKGVSLFDLVKIKQELEDQFKRKVDIVTKKGIGKSKNPYKKKLILETARLYYNG